MTDKLLSTPAAFFATAWGRILAILAAISMLMGIGIEAQSLITGYYNMKRAAAEAVIADTNAKVATTKAAVGFSSPPADRQQQESVDARFERLRKLRAEHSWKDDGIPSPAVPAK